MLIQFSESNQITKFLNFASSYHFRGGRGTRNCMFAIKSEPCTMYMTCQDKCSGHYTHIYLSVFSLCSTNSWERKINNGRTEPRKKYEQELTILGLALVHSPFCQLCVPLCITIHRKQKTHVEMQLKMWLPHLYAAICYQ